MKIKPCGKYGAKKLLVWKQVKFCDKATWSKNGHSWWFWQLISPGGPKCVSLTSQLKTWRSLHCLYQLKAFRLSIFDRYVSLGLFTMSLHNILKLWFISDYNLGYFTKVQFTILEQLKVVATLGDYIWNFVVATLDSKISPQGLAPRVFTSSEFSRQEYWSG